LAGLGPAWLWGARSVDPLLSLGDRQELRWGVSGLMLVSSPCLRLLWDFGWFVRGSGFGLPSVLVRCFIEWVCVPQVSRDVQMMCLRICLVCNGSDGKLVPASTAAPPLSLAYPLSSTSYLFVPYATRSKRFNRGDGSQDILEVLCGF
jgi:hypothetical protein